jgi:ketosteroid isomerase-like protein
VCDTPQEMRSLPFDRVVRSSLLVAALLAGCGGGHPVTTTPTGPTGPAATEVVTPLAWAADQYEGDADDGSGQLHVVPVEGATYAIWLGDKGGARVWIVDETDETTSTLSAWVFAGIPGSPTVDVLPALSAGSSVARFGVRDSSRLLTIRRTATAGLVISLAGTARPFVTDELGKANLARDTALEYADRNFAAASKARGADAWGETVAEHGVIYRAGGFIAGRAAVRAASAKTLAAGTLSWEPVSSGRARDGQIGFTVGKSHWVGKGSEPAADGSYVTIWQQQPDASWKWIFDAGRPR